MLSNQYDITIKDLFSDQKSTQDLVAFFAKTDLRLTGDLSIEFSQVEEKRSDLLLRAGDETSEVAMHLEFQSYNDPEMGYRMLRYCGAILRKYQLPVHQTVIYFGDAEMNMDSGLCYDVGRDNRLDFRYRLADVGQVSYNEILNHPNQYLRAFLPLVERKRRKKEKAKFLERCLRDIMASDLPLEDKKKLLLRAEIFSGLVFKDDVIDLVFREVEEMFDLEESAGYRRLFRKAEEKGEIKAKKEDIQQCLERHFGEKSIDIRRMVDRLSGLDILNAVLVELFTTNTLEEARLIVRSGLDKSLQESKACEEVKKLPPDTQKDLFRQLHGKRMRRSVRVFGSMDGQVLREEPKEPYTANGPVKRVFRAIVKPVEQDSRMLRAGADNLYRLQRPAGSKGQESCTASDYASMMIEQDG